MNLVSVEALKSLSIAAVNNFYKIVILMAILLPLAWYDRGDQRLSYRCGSLAFRERKLAVGKYDSSLSLGKPEISVEDLFVERNGIFAFYKHAEKRLYLVYSQGFQKISLPEQSALCSMAFDADGIFLYLVDVKDRQLRVRKISCNNTQMQLLGVFSLPQELESSLKIVDTKITDTSILLCINQNQLWNISLKPPYALRVFSASASLGMHAGSDFQILQKVLIREKHFGKAFLVFLNPSFSGETSVFLREYDFVSHLAGDVYSLGHSRGALLGINGDQYVVWSKVEDEFFFCTFQSFVDPQDFTFKKIPVDVQNQIAGVFAGQWSTVGVFLTPSAIKFCAWSIR